MLEGYDDKLLTQILQNLGDQRSPSGSHAPDSGFSTAATVIMEDVATGKVYLQTAANMEPSVANGSNICAERIALGAIVSEFKRDHARGRNGELKLRAVFVQGGPNSMQIPRTIEKPNYCMCCYKCLDALMPFASDEPTKPSLVHLVTTMRNTPAHISFARDHIISYDIKSLAASVLNIDVAEAFNWRGRKARGICKTQNIQQLYSAALRPLVEKAKLPTNLPPLIGEITPWMKAALEMSNGETKWVTLILAAARNQLYEINSNHNIQHIEVSISGTKDGSFFINGGVSGKGISRTDSALYRVSDGPYGVNRDLVLTQIWIMGDGYDKLKRLYPTITDLHGLNKRGDFHIEDGKRVSDVHLMIYPPVHAFSHKPLTIDQRSRQARITTEPPQGVIARVSLSELCMGASGFVSAKTVASRTR